MSAKRRKFRRPLGELRYRKLFVIAVEGNKTEPQYFAIFNKQQSTVRVHCLKKRKVSAPFQVLRLMKAYLKQNVLRPSDEAWLVVDRDHWTEGQLSQLYAWSQKRSNYGFALSNPKFEYWLLLHFEDGNNIASIQECTNRLKQYLPNYDKGIAASKITASAINDAIRRAKQRNTPPCTDWPRRLGGTTVYILVENIIKPDLTLMG